MKGTQNSLGSMADELLELRTNRIQLEKQAKEIKAKESALTYEMMERLGEQKLTGARGSVATVALSSQTVGSVVDWNRLEDYVRDTGHFQLFQRRISNPAFLELLGHGESVPGVDSTTLTKLSLTRSKR